MQAHAYPATPAGAQPPEVAGIVPPAYHPFAEGGEHVESPKKSKGPLSKVKNKAKKLKEKLKKVTGSHSSKTHDHGDLNTHDHGALHSEHEMGHGDRAYQPHPNEHEHEYDDDDDDDEEDDHILLGDDQSKYEQLRSIGAMDKPGHSSGVQMHGGVPASLLAATPGTYINTGFTSPYTSAGLQGNTPISPYKNAGPPSTLQAAPTVYHYPPANDNQMFGGMTYGQFMGSPNTMQAAPTGYYYPPGPPNTMQAAPTGHYYPPGPPNTMQAAPTGHYYPPANDSQMFGGMTQAAPTGYHYPLASDNQIFGGPSQEQSKPSQFQDMPYTSYNYVPSADTSHVPAYTSYAKGPDASSLGAGSLGVPTSPTTDFFPQRQPDSSEGLTAFGVNVPYPDDIVKPNPDFGRSPTPMHNKIAAINEDVPAETRLDVGLAPADFGSQESLLEKSVPENAPMTFDKAEKSVDRPVSDAVAGSFLTSPVDVLPTSTYAMTGGDKFHVNEQEDESGIPFTEADFLRKDESTRGQPAFGENVSDGDARRQSPFSQNVSDGGAGQLPYNEDVEPAKGNQQSWGEWSADKLNNAKDAVTSTLMGSGKRDDDEQSNAVAGSFLTSPADVLPTSTYAMTGGHKFDLNEQEDERGISFTGADFPRKDKSPRGQPAFGENVSDNDARRQSPFSQNVFDGGAGQLPYNEKVEPEKGNQQSWGKWSVDKLNIAKDAVATTLMGSDERALDEQPFLHTNSPSGKWENEQEDSKGSRGVGSSGKDASEEPLVTAVVSDDDARSQSPGSQNVSDEGAMQPSYIKNVEPAGSDQQSWGEWSADKLNNAKEAVTSTFLGSSERDVDEQPIVDTASVGKGETEQEDSRGSRATAPRNDDENEGYLNVSNDEARGQRTLSEIVSDDDLSRQSPLSENVSNGGAGQSSYTKDVEPSSSNQQSWGEWSADKLNNAKDAVTTTLMNSGKRDVDEQPIVDTSVGKGETEQEDSPGSGAVGSFENYKSEEPLVTAIGDGTTGPRKDDENEGYLKESNDKTRGQPTLSENVSVDDPSRQSVFSQNVSDGGAGQSSYIKNVEPAGSNNQQSWGEWSADKLNNAKDVVTTTLVGSGKRDVDEQPIVDTTSVGKGETEQEDSRGSGAVGSLMNFESEEPLVTDIRDGTTGPRKDHENEGYLNESNDEARGQPILSENVSDGDASRQSSYTKDVEPSSNNQQSWGEWSADKLNNAKDAVTTTLMSSGKRDVDEQPIVDTTSVGKGENEQENSRGSRALGSFGNDQSEESLVTADGNETRGPRKEDENDGYLNVSNDEAGGQPTFSEKVSDNGPKGQQSWGEWSADKLNNTKDAVTATLMGSGGRNEDEQPIVDTTSVGKGESEQEDLRGSGAVGSFEIDESEEPLLTAIKVGTSGPNKDDENEGYLNLLNDDERRQPTFSETVSDNDARRQSPGGEAGQLSSPYNSNVEPASSNQQSWGGWSADKPNDAKDAATTTLMGSGGRALDEQSYLHTPSFGKGESDQESSRGSRGVGSFGNDESKEPLVTAIGAGTNSSRKDNENEDYLNVLNDDASGQPTFSENVSDDDARMQSPLSQIVSDGGAGQLSYDNNLEPASSNQQSWGGGSADNVKDAVTANLMGSGERAADEQPIVETTSFGEDVTEEPLVSAIGDENSGRRKENEMESYLYGSNEDARGQSPLSNVVVGTTPLGKGETEEPLPAIGDENMDCRKDNEMDSNLYGSNDDAQNVMNDDASRQSPARQQSPIGQDVALSDKESWGKWSGDKLNHAKGGSETQIYGDDSRATDIQPESMYDAADNSSSAVNEAASTVGAIPVVGADEAKRPHDSKDISTGLDVNSPLYDSADNSGNIVNAAAPTVGAIPFVGADEAKRPHDCNGINTTSDVSTPPYDSADNNSNLATAAAPTVGAFPIVGADEAKRPDDQEVINTRLDGNSPTSVNKDGQYYDSNYTNDSRFQEGSGQGTGKAEEVASTVAGSAIGTIQGLTDVVASKLGLAGKIHSDSINAEDVSTPQAESEKSDRTGISKLDLTGKTHSDHPHAKDDRSPQAESEKSPRTGILQGLRNTVASTLGVVGLSSPKTSHEQVNHEHQASPSDVNTPLYDSADNDSNLATAAAPTVGAFPIVGADEAKRPDDHGVISTRLAGNSPTSVNKDGQYYDSNNINDNQFQEGSGQGTGKAEEVVSTVAGSAIGTIQGLTDIAASKLGLASKTHSDTSNTEDVWTPRAESEKISDRKEISNLDLTGKTHSDHPHAKGGRSPQAENEKSPRTGIVQGLRNTVASTLGVVGLSSPKTSHEQVDPEHLASPSDVNTPLYDSADNDRNLATATAPTVGAFLTVGADEAKRPDDHEVINTRLDGNSPTSVNKDGQYDDSNNTNDSQFQEGFGQGTGKTEEVASTVTGSAIGMMQGLTDIVASKVGLAGNTHSDTPNTEDVSTPQAEREKSSDRKEITNLDSTGKTHSDYPYAEDGRSPQAESEKSPRTGIVQGLRNTVASTLDGVGLSSPKTSHEQVDCKHQASPSDVSIPPYNSADNDSNLATATAPTVGAFPIVGADEAKRPDDNEVINTRLDGNRPTSVNKDGQYYDSNNTNDGQFRGGSEQGTGMAEEVASKVGLAGNTPSDTPNTEDVWTPQAEREKSSDWKEISSLDITGKTHSDHPYTEDSRSPQAESEKSPRTEIVQGLRNTVASTLGVMGLSSPKTSHEQVDREHQASPSDVNTPPYDSADNDSNLATATATAPTVGAFPTVGADEAKRPDDHKVITTRLDGNSPTRVNKDGQYYDSNNTNDGGFQEGFGQGTGKAEEVASTVTGSAIGTIQGLTDVVASKVGLGGNTHSDTPNAEDVLTPQAESEKSDRTGISNLDLTGKTYTHNSNAEDGQSSQAESEKSPRTGIVQGLRNTVASTLGFVGLSSPKTSHEQVVHERQAIPLEDEQGNVPQRQQHGGGGALQGLKNVFASKLGYGVSKVPQNNEIMYDESGEHANAVKAGHCEVPPVSSALEEDLAGGNLPVN